MESVESRRRVRVLWVDQRRWRLMVSLSTCKQLNGINIIVKYVERRKAMK